MLSFRNTCHRQCFARLSRAAFSIINAPFSWISSDDSLAAVVSSELVLKPDFISETEESTLVSELDTHLSKHRYEDAHWDYAITHYRETERKQWQSVNRPVINRLKQLTVDSLWSRLSDQVEDMVLPLIHVLDLSEEGEIRAHIDSVRYCGDCIAVVSLLSDSVLRLAVAPAKEVVGIPSTHSHLLQIPLPPAPSHVDIFVPRRSVYVMRGASRYLMTHAILSKSEVCQLRKNSPACPVYTAVRSRRISVICRTRAANNLIEFPQSKDTDTPS